MTDLITFIEDLEMLDALDPVAREAHLEYLINQYKNGKTTKTLSILIATAKAREAEIKRTAKLYREGKLTPAMMKKIDRERRKG